MLVTEFLGSNAPAMLRDHESPPSRLRNMPPFSVPTYIRFLSAIDISIALVLLPSRNGDTAAQDVPAVRVRQTRLVPVKTVLGDKRSIVRGAIQIPFLSVLEAGGETFRCCRPRNREMFRS